MQIPMQIPMQIQSGAEAQKLVKQFKTFQCTLTMYRGKSWYHFGDLSGTLSKVALKSLKIRTYLKLGLSFGLAYFHKGVRRDLKSLSSGKVEVHLYALKNLSPFQWQRIRGILHPHKQFYQPLPPQQTAVIQKPKLVLQTPKLIVTAQSQTATLETIVETKQLTDVEKLKQFCNRLDELMNHHRAKELYNTKYFNEELNRLEIQIDQAKAWLEYPDDPELKKFLPKCDSVQERLISSIRALREGEIKELSYNIKTQTNIEMTPPPFKQFDPETEKLMQKRWLLLQNPAFEKHEMERKLHEAIRQGRFTEAKEQARALWNLHLSQDYYKYDRLETNISALEHYFNSYLKNFDFVEFKKKVSNDLLLLLRLGAKYDRFLNDDKKGDFSKIISDLLKLKNLSLNTQLDKSENREIERLERDLPAEIFTELKVRMYASQKPHITWNENMFVEGVAEDLKGNHVKRCEEAQKQIDEILKLPIAEEAKAKLQACRQVFGGDLSHQAHWDVLHEHFPEQYATYQLEHYDERIATCLLEEQWLTTFLQILDNLKAETISVNV